VNRVEAFLFAVAVAGLVSVGWLVGYWVGSEAKRAAGERWLDLYDVFDEEDQDAIG
jgi:hypothetical protein